jgi:hypothetical protein
LEVYSTRTHLAAQFWCRITHFCPSSSPSLDCQRKSQSWLITVQVQFLLVNHSLSHLNTDQLKPRY